jgi:predicted DNA-binding transcriptional regulator YafY
MKMLVAAYLQRRKKPPMPKNLAFSLRLKVLDECLHDSVKRWSIEELQDRIADRFMEEFGSKKDAPSISTIRGDLKYLRNIYKAPIPYPARKGYYYEDRSFTIKRISIADEELDAIMLMMRFLEQFKDTALYRQYKGAMEHILDQSELSASKHYDPSFIEFEPGPAAAGQEWLDPLIASIRQKQPLRIRYKSYYAESTRDFEVSPYYLKQYEGRWYLIAYNHQKHKLRTFGLDRVQDLKELDQTYIESDFDPKDYYRHFIGITVLADAQPKEVILATSPQQAGYFKSRPWHHSQEIIKEEKDEVWFRFFVVVTEEFLMKIRAQGKRVRVVEPSNIGI